MPGVSAEQVARAKEVNLLSYLQANEPHNLRRTGAEYHLADHDSLKISPNGKWNWHSRGFGDRTALDYLIKVRGLSFVAAVEALVGDMPVLAQPLPPSRPVEVGWKPDALPHLGGRFPGQPLPNRTDTFRCIRLSDCF